MRKPVQLLWLLAAFLFSLATPALSMAQDEGAAAGGDASDDEASESDEEATNGVDADRDAEEAEDAAEQNEAEAAAAAETASETDGENIALTPPGYGTRIIPDEDPANTQRTIFPPYYHEQRGNVSTTVLFPLYANRSAPDDSQLLIGPYYRRRGSVLRADVVFPVLWSFRGADSLTWVVPPVYSRTRTEGFDFGIAPLVFAGRKNESVYTIVPPLLTVSWANADHAHTFAGPFWRIRDHENEDWGVFPILWSSNHETFSRFISPLFLRFTNEENHSALSIVPPVYHRVSDTSASWGLAPLLFHHHDETSSYTNVAGVFHYGRSDNGDTRLVSPLFAYDRSGDATTFISWVYQRHRGETSLDAVAPLFFYTRDPRNFSYDVVVPPLLFWHHESPAGATTIAPGFVHDGETGRYDTFVTPLFGHYQNHERDRAGTWIFPTFEISHTEQSQTFNIHPLVYQTNATTHRHFVIAPLFWHFENDETDSSSTVIAPIFWRFRTHDTTSQLALNTYWHEHRSRAGSSWEFHFFPLFAFGEDAPGDNWWNVLYGLVGYSRHGSYARMRVLYVPFQVDGPAEADAPAAPTPPAPPAESAGADPFGMRF